MACFQEMSLLFQLMPDIFPGPKVTHRLNPAPATYFPDLLLRADKFTIAVRSLIQGSKIVDLTYFPSLFLRLPFVLTSMRNKPGFRQTHL